MHWDFYTVLAVVSGIVLIVAALGGPVVGSPNQRLGSFALGAFSLGYGIWVAGQTSGFYMFSLAPAGAAVGIIIRAVQHAGRQKPQAGRPGQGTAGPPAGAPAAAAPAPPQQQNRTASSGLRAAQPDRIREAVLGRSTAFCPAFQLSSAPAPATPAGGGDYRQSQWLAFGWSLSDGLPRLPAGEELLGVWQAAARLKVAIGSDLSPAQAGHGVSWVTALDGSGLIALSRTRVMGIVVRGDSLAGAFGGAGDIRAAFWCLPLRRLSSVSPTQVGHGEGLMLSSSEPAGHVTLTAASVPLRQLAHMVSQARAELANSVSR